MKERKATTLTWAFRDKKKFFDNKKIKRAVHFINNHPEVEFFINKNGIFWRELTKMSKKVKC